MLKLTKQDKTTELDKEIERLTLELQMIPVYSDEYIHQMETIERLTKIRGEKPKRWWQSISWDTVLVVFAGLIQTVMILKHEELNVISTKAMNFIMRRRA